MTVEQTINQKLNDELHPTHLEVINESYMHNVPAGSESHFKVIIVSEAFEGARLVGRHRMVNKVLSEELAEHIHALSIQAFTPQQWSADKINPSPKCLGGSKKG